MNRCERQFENILHMAGMSDSTADDYSSVFTLEQLVDERDQAE